MNQVMEKTFGVLCDKRILLRLKCKFYKSVVRPTILYGLECCWVVNKQIKQKISVSKDENVQMDEYIVIKEDRIKNKYLRGSLGLMSIMDKIREGKLR